MLQLILITPLLAAIHGSEDFGAPRPSVTVCEVLSDLDRYRGRMVAIRGIFEEGRHGAYLFDLTDDKCRTRSRRMRNVPADLVLDYADWKEMEGGPPPFESSRESVRTALEEARRTTEGGHDFIIVATLYGELRSRRGIRIFFDENRGGWYGNGYGSMGASAAFLVIKSVSDISLVSRSAIPREEW